MLEWMGLNIYYYDGLQPKMSAGIINEHECIIRSSSYSQKDNDYLSSHGAAHESHLRGLISLAPKICLCDLLRQILKPLGATVYDHLSFSEGVHSNKQI